MHTSRAFKLAVICGGPSQERGISLNSARSVMDHLKSPYLEIIPLYVDYRKQFYRISPAQLYSNTPADFDFKLKDTSDCLDSSALAQVLKDVDLAFPVIHGSFGEDGELQTLLEHYQIPFIGHSSSCCKWMFRKHLAAETLRSHGFAVLPQAIISDQQQDQQNVIERFFHEHQLHRAIVKPTVGGSSIGVCSVISPQEAYTKLQEIFTSGLDSQALVEPFCEGHEFTVVVFENGRGEPVALIPTEVELSYDNNQIFDYRKKYLPTNQAAYHTPPRFSETIVKNIRVQAEQIFKLFGMRDFVRLDGWVMKGGALYFSDINPISGLEQNSFFFRQASILGMTHRQALEYIMKRACERQGLNFPIDEKRPSNHPKQLVYVLFGSHNAERQVSLMSGTNVWLKLLQSPYHAPIPFLLDLQGDIWELPYSYTLNHTVEEIFANCLTAQDKHNLWHDLKEAILLNLGIESGSQLQPSKMCLDHFFERARREQAFVFIGMHGGEGENGTFQHRLETLQIPFNGSNSEASAVCMDKYMTGQVIQRLGDPDILTIPKKSISFVHFEGFQASDFENIWQSYCQELESKRLIIKPRSDGCSTGIVLLQSAQDLQRYCFYLYQKVSYIPPFSFEKQRAPIEMAPSLENDYLLEPYIETDEIVIYQDQLQCSPKEGWIELTVGVLESQGICHAFNPSIIVAEGAILSLEEKFQGGTGINLTPPPESILPVLTTKKIKHLIEKAAQALGIQNYARLDIFFNRFTEKMILIEANTLPGLTPSTVIYHQALAEEPSLTPLDLLDKIISSKLNTC
jgi:D-alanine--D-alanine ligase